MNNMKCKFPRVGVTSALVAAVLMLAGLLPARAQWLTQTNVLVPGWSAVYLLVDPSSQSLDNLVGSDPGNPIDQVALFKTPASAAQYIQNPSQPLSTGGPFVTWLRSPTNTPNTLATLIPNAGYYVHSSATSNYTWKVQGQPVLPVYTWDLTGLNFIGFSTPSANPPNFQDFLAPDPVLATGAQILQITGSALTPGNSQTVSAVTTTYLTPVTRGVAFWVSDTNVNNTYFGPFSVTLPNGSGLAYGTTVGQLTVNLINFTTNYLTVSVRLLNSETSPAGQATITGPPPLLIEGVENTNTLTYPAIPLPVGTLYQWTLAPAGQPGSEVSPVVGLNRFALLNHPGALYAGILQFTDSLGLSEVDVPVSATATDNTGLWVGNASVSQVSYDLKTYATNNDGSLMVNTIVTNVMTTNPAVLLATNLVINNTFATNTVITYWATNSTTNITWTVYSSQFQTNAYVLITNLFIQRTTFTNQVIETDIVDWDFDTNGNLVWITENITNAPQVASTQATNLVILTDNLPAGIASGTLINVTNWVVNQTSVLSQQVTNDLELVSYTNTLVATNYASTNYYAGTSPARVFTTTQLSTNTYGTQVVTTLPLGATTNVTVAVSAVTNYVPVAKPLEVITNGSVWTTYNVATNNYYLVNQAVTVTISNFPVTVNNYAISGGTTNLTSNFYSPGLFSYAYYTNNAGTTNFSHLSVLINKMPAFVVSPLTLSYSNYVVAAVNTQLDKVVTPYPLRLIVFNDTNGNCSLLQRVYFGMRQTTNIIVATTESVLDPGSLSTARCIVATHLPWTSANTPWTLNGQLTQGGSLLAVVTEPYDDQAANPFLHTYHPDHNNLNMANSPPTELAPGAESYTVTRQISLSMASTNNLDFVSLTQSGSSLNGTYYETISLSGLGGATKSYQTAGTFILNRISTVPALTTP